MPDAPKKNGIEACIREVTFGRTFNLGNYESMRIDLTATVTDEFTVAEVLKALDKATVRYRNGKE